MRVQFQEEKMHTKDAIKFALTVSNGAVLSVIDEMSGAATTFPTPNGGGHTVSALGRLPLAWGFIPGGTFCVQKAPGEREQPIPPGQGPPAAPRAAPHVSPGSPE